jgi:NADH:ubiquinone oxidoreductase subunit H
MFSVVEIVISVMILAYFANHFVSHTTSAVSAGIISSSGSANSIAILILTFVSLPLILFELEKVPFDLVEAESELIDGITTEFDGFSFSIVYAAEVAVGFLLLKLLTLFSGYMVGTIFLLVALTFVGRIFLCRFLVADAIETFLTIGLAFTTVILVSS